VSISLASDVTVHIHAKLSTLHEASCAPSMHCYPLDVFFLLKSMHIMQFLLSLTVQQPVLLFQRRAVLGFILNGLWLLQEPCNGLDKDSCRQCFFNDGLMAYAIGDASRMDVVGTRC
jgi:hypothetical protein